MKTVLGDTYYFLAIGNDRDQGHRRAVEFATNYTGRMLTTEWVLTEVADALSSPERREQFLILLALIGSDENWTVVQASHELFERGVALFSQRADKSWSLTDCISFVVMGDQGLSEALTADQHFEQAGFVRLLK